MLITLNIKCCCNGTVANNIFDSQLKIMLQSFLMCHSPFSLFLVKDNLFRSIGFLGNAVTEIYVVFYDIGVKEIDIAATLEHIRDQRPGMVRTKVTQAVRFVISVDTNMTTSESIEILCYNSVGQVRKIFFLGS